MHRPSSSSSASRSVSESTFEISLPDSAFEAFFKVLTQEERIPQSPRMARDAFSRGVSQPRRSTYSVGQPSTTSRTRVLGDGGAVQCPSRMDGSQYSSSSTSSSSVSASSNITGYRARLDVPGMPESDYFVSGASKRDRRPEYTGRMPSSNIARTNTYPTGKEVVQYGGGQQLCGEVADNEIDDATVSPADSISQVSSSKSRPSVHSHRSSRSYNGGYVPPASNSRANSSAFGESTSAYGERCEYERAKNYQTVERRPRGR